MVAQPSVSPLGGYGNVAGAALEIAATLVRENLEPSGTLSIPFLKGLGPSNAAFDGP
jgi:hypothetical protein